MTHLELREHLNELRAGQAPIPLPNGPLADRQALQLRRTHGMPYPSIAMTMGVYHGVWLSDSTWRNRLRQLGAVPTKPGFTRKGDTARMVP